MSAKVIRQFDYLTFRAGIRRVVLLSRGAFLVALRIVVRLIGGAFLLDFRTVFPLIGGAFFAGAFLAGALFAVFTGALFAAFVAGDLSADGFAPAFRTTITPGDRPIVAMRQ
jgi:hypothetical protein